MPSAGWCKDVNRNRLLKGEGEGDFKSQLH